MSLKTILNGFSNLALVELKIIKKSKQAQDRLIVCASCEFKTTMNTCAECGCYLPAKSLVKEEHCPKNKWP